MKRMTAALAVLVCIFFAHLPAAIPQNTTTFPAAVFSAKTVAIVNDTHTDAVTEGAQEALRAWGHFVVTDDPDSADITLRFDKSKDRSGQDTQKTGDDGKSSYSYSMSFSSSIHMKAYTKEGTEPFYTTKTDDSKKKAGVSCVDDFRSAFAVAQQKTTP